MSSSLRISRKIFLAAFVVGFASVLAFGQRQYLRSEADAQKIVKSVLKVSPIIDGHSDLFAWYFGCSYKKLPKCPQGIDDGAPVAIGREIVVTDRRGFPRVRRTDPAPRRGDVGLPAVVAARPAARRSAI